MSNLQLWSLVIGFALPPVLAVVQQSKWAEWLRAVVAFLACAVAGAGVAYFQGDLTGKRFVEAGLVVLVTAMATYRNFWKPIKIAPMIEAKTNLPSASKTNPPSASTT